MERGGLTTDFSDFSDGFKGVKQPCRPKIESLNPNSIPNLKP